MVVQSVVATTKKKTLKMMPKLKLVLNGVKKNSDEDVDDDMSDDLTVGGAYDADEVEKMMKKNVL